MNHVVSVVTRDGQEVEWFENDKDAAAYVQHVYGLTPYDLIGHESIAIGGLRDRGPKPGDLVKTAEGQGVLGHDGFVTMRASTFRAGGRVSCSGGPCPFVEVDRLRFIGLEQARCWRWADGYPAAHNGGNYTVTVPVWEEAK
jgi:hypothetical protein